MTMRSMPPASSHFADKPVPAPPPISGRPAAILARKRSSSVFLAMRGIRAGERCGWGVRRDFAPRSDQRLDEGVVVDVIRQANELALGAGSESFFERREQRPIGFRVVER